MTNNQSMNLVCQNSFEMDSRKNLFNKIKMKIKDLLEEVEMCETNDREPSIVKYLSEMVEENKTLNRKCRELAHVVKHLKNENKEFQKRENEMKHQCEIQNQYDHNKLELQDEIESLRSELVESRNIVQLLTAQVVTYREDFEMERRDRERAIEKINVLEGRLVGHDKQAHSEIVSPETIYSSHDLHLNRPNNHRHQHHRQESNNNCLCDDLHWPERVELIPRCFGGPPGRPDQAQRTDRAVSLFKALHSALDDDKIISNPQKRKLNHEDSFDEIFDGKLQSLE